MDPTATRVVEALQALDAEFETLPIDPDLADTAAFCERYGYRLDESANAILVASRKPEGVHAVCVALATTRLDVNHAVRRLLGVQRLSFAPADLTRQVTGMEIGGVTPFGLPDGLRVLVDAAVMGLSRCIVGGGSRAMKVSLDPEAFRRLPGAEVVEGLAVRPDPIPGDLPSSP